jgi:hypothetical protein
MHQALEEIFINAGIEAVNLICWIMKNNDLCVNQKDSLD